MSNTLLPGIVEMRDTDGNTYLVDETLSYILINRRVWTDPETHELMVEDMSYKQRNTITMSRLADWLYRIMALNDLPKDLSIGFQDQNRRNITYLNLVRLPKGQSANVLREPSIPSNPALLP